MEKIRIQKLLSALGIDSRRHVEEAIKNNEVYVDDKLAILGQLVDENSKIIYKNKLINQKNITTKKYILFNKPKNLICTNNDPQKRKTIFDYLGLKEYTYSIGRLDFNTTGIIIVTNDGEFANLMAHPSSNILREYIVKLEKPLSDEDIKFLNSDNVILESKKSKQKVTKLNDLIYSVILYEGWNHHVKNLFALVNNYVINLHRKRYGEFSDENLPIGKWKEININKINAIKDKLKGE